MIEPFQEYKELILHELLAYALALFLGFEMADPKRRPYNNLVKMFQAVNLVCFDKGPPFTRLQVAAGQRTRANIETIEFCWLVL